MRNVYFNVRAIEDRFEKAQAYLDNRVLTDSNKYIPIDSNDLRRAGGTGTVIGTGEVVWASPYAHYMYTGLDMIQEGTENRHWAERYSRKVYNGRELTYSQGGKEWFERAKREYHKSWMKGVAERMQT